MRRTIIFLFLLIIIGSLLYAQTPEWLWAAQAGGSSYDTGYGITIDDLGNTYVTGGFEGTANFGTYSLTSNGDWDIFVAKMNSNGNWQWAAQAGGSINDYGYGITIDDSGNTYVIGCFESTATFGSYSLTSNGYKDIFVAKMDANGSWQWAAHAGGSSLDHGNGITIDDLGNTYVIGWFYETATFGSYSLTSYGGTDIFVAKMDANGNWLWVTQAGGSDQYFGNEITIDDLGNTYVTGSFKNTATFGSYSLTSNGYDDIFVAKMDAMGNWQWATGAGGFHQDWGYGITIDDERNTYVTGSFKNTATFGSYSLTSNGYDDIFVAKMDATGNWQWAAQAGGSSLDQGYGITIDDERNTYVTGMFRETATFGSYSLTSYGSRDVFVAKMDATGNWQWAAQAGGNNEDYGKGGITIDYLGNTYVTGRFEETATFGSYSLTSNGEADIFVAKLGRDFVANFIADITFGYYPSIEVNFTNLSGSVPTNWFWDFQNDGVYDSFEQNPTFTYTDVGEYSVKLKISDGTLVDSLIKHNYITVEYVPPAPPTNVQVNISGDDVILNWAAVDTTIFGTPIEVDYYIIYQSDEPNGNWQFSGA
ncbi:MAG: SBBP repeat-containing protein, partial [Candidatus Cloacimonetes bacterium]|nr:SBBP repeat-containing protein [Candidatus Cloacimonadota bacterium]